MSSFCLLVNKKLGWLFEESLDTAILPLESYTSSFFLTVTCGNLFTCSRCRSWICRLGSFNTCWTSKLNIILVLFSNGIWLATVNFWMVTLFATVWWSTCNYWTWRGNNHIRDRLFTNRVEEVKRLCFFTIHVHCPIYANTAVHTVITFSWQASSCSEQIFLWRAKDEAISTSWLMYRDWILNKHTKRKCWLWNDSCSKTWSSSDQPNIQFCTVSESEYI